MVGPPLPASGTRADNRRLIGSAATVVMPEAVDRGRRCSAPFGGPTATAVAGLINMAVTAVTSGMVLLCQFAAKRLL